jgi:hypothetical protein
METKTNNYMTGAEWAKSMNIQFSDLSGWFTEEDFQTKKLYRGEFLLRASNSKIVHNKNISRRDAAKFRGEMLNKK